MGTAVDTLKVYERLKAADLPDRAAKEIAEVFNDVIEENLATKKGLSEMEMRINLKLAELKHDLTVRMGAIAAAIVAILTAIMKFS